MNVLLILSLSTLSSTLFILTLWLLAANFGPLAGYSVLYGGVAGGFSVLYARFVTAISIDNDRGLWLYGLLACVRGVAYVLAGPISGAMLPSSIPERIDYRILIIGDGCAFAISSLGGLGRILRPMPLVNTRRASVVHDVESVLARFREASAVSTSGWMAGTTLRVPTRSLELAPGCNRVLG